MKRAREKVNHSESEKLRQTVDELGKALGRVERINNLDGLRGIEGETAASYFGVLPLLINKNPGAWKFMRRTRRPPRDPINAMLSFLYTILTHDVRSALEGVGLDPQVGYLHALRPGRPALALDLMEEFRTLFVDRLILARINLNQVGTKDFKSRSGGAVEMTEEARKELIIDYQNRKREEVTHPLSGRKVPIGLIPHLQARVLARYIRGEGPGYVPFMAK